MQRFGQGSPGRVDFTKLKPFSEIEVAEWDKVMAVNVRGPFVCAKAVVPFMRSKGYGRIVNISSGTPFKGTPNLLHYVTSKDAILALIRALAREVGGDGICLNTLAPGLVLSEGVIQNIDMREKLTGPVLTSRAIKRDRPRKTCSSRCCSSPPTPALS